MELRSALTLSRPVLKMRSVRAFVSSEEEQPSSSLTSVSSGEKQTTVSLVTAGKKPIYNNGLSLVMKTQAGVAQRKGH